MKHLKADMICMAIAAAALPYELARSSWLGVFMMCVFTAGELSRVRRPR